MGVRFSAWCEGKARSAAIDRQIKKESRSCRKVYMLLLGTICRISAILLHAQTDVRVYLGTDPDRSKIVKQMKVQHGVTHDERMHHRLTVYQNSLNSAQALVRAIRDMGIEYVDPTNHVIFRLHSLRSSLMHPNRSMQITSLTITSSIAFHLHSPRRLLRPYISYGKIQFFQKSWTVEMNSGFPRMPSS